MVIYYLAQMAMSGASADWSYNAAWLSLWSYAELSLGVLVTCTLSVPKFAKVEGERTRRACRIITMPFRSSVGSSNNFLRSAKEDDGSATEDTSTRDGTGVESLHADAIEKEIGRLV